MSDVVSNTLMAEARLASFTITLEGLVMVLALGLGDRSLTLSLLYHL